MEEGEVLEADEGSAAKRQKSGVSTTSEPPGIAPRHPLEKADMTRVCKLARRRPTRRDRGCSRTKRSGPMLTRRDNTVGSSTPFPTARRRIWRTSCSARATRHRPRQVLCGRIRSGPPSRFWSGASRHPRDTLPRIRDQTARRRAKQPGRRIRLRLDRACFCRATILSLVESDANILQVLFSAIQTPSAGPRTALPSGPQPGWQLCVLPRGSYNPSSHDTGSGFVEAPLGAEVAVRRGERNRLEPRE